MSDITTLNTYNYSPEFFNNEVIKNLADNPKWTISVNKMPVNLLKLRLNNEIRGANINEEFTTDTLYESTKLIEDKLTMIGKPPIQANHAYFLDTVTDDGYVVIDIEPTCPDDLKEELLKMPYLYGETSLSGKGIHLIMKQPKNLPLSLTEKVVVKPNNKYFEILQSHWVTFTRNTIEPISNPETDENKNALYDLYMKLMKENKRYQMLKTDNNLNIGKLPDITNIPGHDIFEKYLANNEINAFEKTPADFGNDMSLYEFNHITFKYNKLKRLMSTDLIRKLNHNYTLEEIMSVMRFIAISVLEPREKHSKKIADGYDYITYTIKSIIEKFGIPA